MEKLISLAKERKTILCFGIDPNLERIDKPIEDYYFEIIDALLEENLISALKPNYAYFAQYGMEGLNTLKNLIQRYNKEYIIFDGKRGDIGKTAEAYANEIYDFWKADAATITAYMGSDTITPFLKKGKIVYVNVKNSNKSAGEFQDLELKDGRKLFEAVAEKVHSLGAGMIIGATTDSILSLKKYAKDSPFLIPGIGAQGGSFEVLSAVKENPFIHRVNSSSSIAFANEKYSLGTVKSAVKEAEFLNSNIKKYLGNL